MTELYPATVIVKVFFTPSPVIQQELLDMTKSKFPELSLQSVQTRYSQTQIFQVLSMEIYATSAYLLNNFYQTIKAHEQVKMVLI